MGFAITMIVEYLLRNFRHANPRSPVEFRRKFLQNETLTPPKKYTLHGITNGITSKIYIPYNM